MAFSSFSYFSADEMSVFMWFMIGFGLLLIFANIVILKSIAHKGVVVNNYKSFFKKYFFDDPNFTFSEQEKLLRRGRINVRLMVCYIGCIGVWFIYKGIQIYLGIPI